MGQRAVQEGKVSKGKAGPTVLDKAGSSSSDKFTSAATRSFSL